jgi:MazG family protein
VKTRPAIADLLRVMARLRSPTGCPWDRAQNHKSIRLHAVEEVYELVDAIEAGDDHEMIEELGDLLLQVVFHSQLARERGAFDFDKVARHLVDKLVRRHPHVFGNSKVRSIDAVWAQWDSIKKAEKRGTRHERPSAFDGIPRHLPALLRVEKLARKARKAGLVPCPVPKTARKNAIARRIFNLAARAQGAGWSAEALLRAEAQRQERLWRRREARLHPRPA